MSLRMTNLVYLMVRRIYLYCEIKHENPWEILFHSISAKLRSLDPTLLYCIASVWTIGGIKLLTLGTTKFSLLDGKVAVLVYMHCKITKCNQSEILFLLISIPNPVVLYRQRLDHSILWLKKLVSHGITKFGILHGKAAVVVYMHGQMSN